MGIIRYNQDIQVVNFYNISGVVTLDDNSNSSGISVILYNNTFNDTILTDSIGYFDFGTVVEGTYNLIFKKTYYDTDSSEIVLQSDTIINKILSRSKGTISGYVDLSDSPSDLSNSIVTIYYDVVTVDTTDATGYYSFSNLPLGKSYKLKFEHNGYAPDSVTFTLEDTSYTYSVNLTKLTGLEETLKIEKIIVEDNGNGIFSFIYNKEVDNPTNIMIYDLTGRNVVNKTVESGKGMYKITLSKRLSKVVGEAEMSIREDVSQVGGGALPLQDLPTMVLILKPRSFSVNNLEESLRKGNPPIIARISKDELILDMRTVFDEEIPLLADGIEKALKRLQAE
jgi:hypothetical protein